MDRELGQQQGNTEQKETSWFNMMDVVSAIGHSSYEFFDGALQQAKGSTAFYQSIYSGIETHSIMNSMGVIAATDLVPIIALNAGMSSLEAFIESQFPEPCFAIKLGLGIAQGTTYALTFRQAFEAFSRATIMQAKQASIYDTATEKTREKVSDEVCKQKGKECSQMRYIKGNVRSPLFYVSHQIAIYALKNFLGEYANIYGFNLFVDGYLALAFGQMIMDYRLANDGLCEPHQAIYNKQYWERGLNIGLPVIFTSKLTSQFLEMATGVHHSLYKPMLETFMAVIMVGVAHHIKLPPSVKETDRFIVNPVSFVRDAAAYCLDKVTPDLQSQAQALMSTPGEPVKYHKKYQTYKENYLTIYLEPSLQVIIKCLLPPMYSSLNAFVNDPVFRQFWPEMRDGLLQLLSQVELRQQQAKGKKIVPKKMKPFVTPIKKHLNPVLRLDKVKAAWSIIETWVVTPVVSASTGYKQEDISKGLEVLRNEDLKNLVIELRQDLESLTLNKKNISFLGYFYPPDIPEDENKYVTFFQQDDESLPEQAQVEEVCEIDITILSKRIKEASNQYLKSLSTYSSRVDSGKAILDTALSFAFNTDYRIDGKLRARYYINALEFYDRNINEGFKLLVCISVLKNSKSSQLLTDIRDKLQEDATGYYPELKEVKNDEAKLFKKLKQQLYKDCYLSITPKDKRQIFSLDEFIQSTKIHINNFISNSNNCISEKSLNESIKKWYADINKKYDFLRKEIEQNDKHSVPVTM